MSERFSDSDPQAPIRAELAEFARERIGWIETAAQQIGGENVTVETVFELPPEIRDEAPAPEWDEQQEVTARELAHSLGYASEHDVVSELSGIDFLEGGKVWKMFAEVEAAGGWSLVISGSPLRPIGEDEKDFLVKRFSSQLESAEEEVLEETVSEYRQSLEGKTEYDVAADIAMELTLNNHSSDDADVLPYGYSLNESNSLIGYKTGQFIHMGTDNRGRDIILMRIDREDYIDEETKEPKYRFQPDPLRRMGIISDIKARQGDSKTPIVFVTSNAYVSRQIDTLRAGLANGRQYGVTMYGRATLASIKDEPMLPGARLNQLPGDIRIMYENLNRLRTEVTS